MGRTARILWLGLVALLLVGCATQGPLRSVPGELMVRTTGASMIPYCTDGEWVGLLLVDFDSLRENQPCIYWHRETRQFVHHFTYRYDASFGGWQMRGPNNATVDRGQMTRAAFVGRTVPLPKQPRFEP